MMKTAKVQSVVLLKKKNIQKFAYLRLFFLFLQCVCQKMMNITENKIDF